jgi:histidine triad (HIT) family protein
MHGEDGIDCEFCGIESFANAGLLIEDEHCFYAGFGPVDPDVLPGSGIVVPRAHRESPFELTAAEWTATHSLIRRAKAAVDDRLRPDGYNLIWNVGDDGGQSQAHVHLHLIPRFHDEPYAGRGARWWLKQPENRRPVPHAPGLGQASARPPDSA